ncbi:MAG TPA: chemotaxis protein CheX [Mycobacteriales bacterium]|nr:chemotaxis protein CheX [Mycobacteriales bacterium]
MTEVLKDDLQAITEQVWQSFLDPEGSDPLLLSLLEPAVSDVAAAVSVTGAWRGHVVIGCSTGASKHAASALLGVSSEEVTEDDVSDALGELANIIGGNVKALLPEPCALSLPYVVASAGVRWPSVQEICRLDGMWRDEPVHITVLESTTDSERAVAS